MPAMAYIFKPKFIFGTEQNKTASSNNPELADSAPA